MTDSEQKLVLSGEGVDLIVHRREMHVYQVTEAELTTMRNVGNAKTQDLAFFTLTVGLAVAFLIALIASTPQSDRVFSAFSVICFASAIFALWFGFRAWQSMRRESRTVEQIRGRGGDLAD